MEGTIFEEHQEHNPRKLSIYAPICTFELVTGMSRAWVPSAVHYEITVLTDEVALETWLKSQNGHSKQRHASLYLAMMIAHLQYPFNQVISKKAHASIGYFTGTRNEMTAIRAKSMIIQYPVVIITWLRSPVESLESIGSLPVDSRESIQVIMTTG